LMERLLVSNRADPRRRWAEAFPGAAVVGSLGDGDAPAAGSLWLDLAQLEGGARAARVAAAAVLGAPVIAMAAAPTEADAFALLSAGARGYCHSGAAARQLREIALVVEHGGLWMPPDLLQRFVSLAGRRPERSPPLGGAPHCALDELTARELAVARAVARGASNREIAVELQIAERTVKAHLTTIFAKLQVRDRVQLALAMNRYRAPDPLDGGATRPL